MGADGQPATLAAACRHCGEPAAAGGPPGYCCTGCAAAAGWIEASGLGDYYRWRTAPAPRVLADADWGAWDREDIQSGWVQTVDGRRRATLAVDGMHCAACAWLIDKALRQLPGVVDVRANVLAARVQVEVTPGQAPLSTVVQRIAALGYRPSLPGSPQRDAERRRDRRALLLRLGVAGLGAMQAMMFSEALYLDTTGSMPIATRDGFRWLAALLAAPVVFYAGAPFLRGLWRDLRMRSPGMDTLIGSAILLAWTGSVVETLRGGPQVWFDAAVMFVLFMLTARLFEQRARDGAASRLDALAGAGPVLAWRERDGALAQVPAAELGVGDVLHVAAGQTLPADGVLLDAPADVDESLLTGESRPRRRTPGETVLAGSGLRTSDARVRVTAVGPSTVLSTMMRRVEQAQRSRPALLERTDAVSRAVVVTTVLLAIVSAMAWAWIDPAQSFPVALAVLVVTCPCALALAVPTVLARAHAVLADRGVLVLGTEALQRLAAIDTIVLDKTGTLTRGVPTVVETAVLDAGMPPDDARGLAAALEAGGAHPLAHAFGNAAPVPVHARRTVAGQGVEGVIDGVCWRLGQAGFAAPGQEDDGAVWLGRGGVAVARFVLDDPVRDDAVATVARLRQRYDVHLMSGDGTARVAGLAARLGLPDDRVRARCTPSAKCDAINALQAAGRRVLMVGDGLNDAAALAAADVSIAMANGAPLALRHADLVLGGDRLAGVVDLIDTAVDARRIVRQNLAWAIAYNALALPVAAMGAMSPGWAALGMAASSLLVSANAWRLGGPR